MVPVGSTVIIRGSIIQIIEGTKRAKSFVITSSGRDGGSRFSRTTLIAAGGITAAVLAGGGGGDSSGDSGNTDFTGEYNFNELVPGGDTLNIDLSLTVPQFPNILGRYRFTQQGPNCDYWYDRGITGEVVGSTTNLTLSVVTFPEVCGGGSIMESFPVQTITYTLQDSGNVLRCTDQNGNIREYQRQ